MLRAMLQELIVTEPVIPKMICALTIKYSKSKGALELGQYLCWSGAVEAALMELASRVKRAF